MRVRDRRLEEAPVSDRSGGGPLNHGGGLSSDPNFEEALNNISRVFPGTRCTNEKGIDKWLQLLSSKP